MNLLDLIVNAQGGGTVRQMGQQVGLNESQTAAALSAVMPALANGLQQNVQTSGGLGGLIAGLGSGAAANALDNPSALADPSAVNTGNGILGQILGSKDVSRSVANQAAAQTGLSADILKRLLPLAATMMMSAVLQRAGAGAAGGLSDGGLASMLGPLLDGNRDGSIVDDVASMLGRGLKRS